MKRARRYASAAVPRAEQDDAPRAARPPRVLVAASDPAKRERVAMRLRDAGLRVLDVDSGYLALDRLADGLLAWPPAQFDLVITCLGADACGDRLFLDLARRLVRPPVVMPIVDGRDEEAARDLLRAGATTVWAEPFSLDDLAFAARYLLIDREPTALA